MDTRTIEIDGSQGEGGGQILRTSLTLAMLYGLSVSIRNIRGRRPKPGLMRQHLTCVKAAQAICNARVLGAELGSRSLRFEPGELMGGNYHFDVGSAGSTTLVFQTIFLPLLKAGSPTTVSFTGGTHNPLAPPLTFLEKAFLPLARKMGARVEREVKSWGFMPAGGGQWTAHITPGPLTPLEAIERPEIAFSQVTAYLSNIRRSVGEREISTYRERCRVSGTDYRIRHPEANCGGNLLAHTLQFGDFPACLTELGRHRLPAEQVAIQLAERVDQFLKQGVVLCEHLADQIMLPLLVAGGGRFSCPPLSLHAASNANLIRSLTGHHFSVHENGDQWVLGLGG